MESLRQARDHGVPSRGSAPDGDCRCACGSLVARILAEGVQLKCRRCKRTLVVPWSARRGWEPPVERAAERAVG